MMEFRQFLCYNFKGDVIYDFALETAIRWLFLKDQARKKDD